MKTSGAQLHAVMGGSGPPLLLIHGAPLTHLSWFRVAPELAKKYTVVAADLRGYGDSSKPEDGDKHINYSKRAMAQDQIDLMKHFGFDRFAVVGHDRGGRVAHRLALDHPQAVTRAAVLDIVPTHYLYTHVTKAFVDAYFHWFLYIRPAPFPEDILNREVQAGSFSRGGLPELRDEYARVYRDPANVHGMCEDYRASAGIDMEFDEADLKAGKKVTCPLARAVGQRWRHGSHVRRARHLEANLRHECHRGCTDRRAQPAGSQPHRCAGPAAAFPRRLTPTHEESPRRARGAATALGR